MTIIHEVHAHLGGGEIDPKSVMRVDMKVYDHCLSRGRNIQLLAGGGGTNRPGTTHVDTLGVFVVFTHEFEFSTDERYLILIYGSQVSIHDANGVWIADVDNPGNSYQDLDIPEIDVAQAGDVMIIMHSKYPTLELRRTGLNTFTLDFFTFDLTNNTDRPLQPYFNYAPAGTEFSVDRPDGHVTITSSVAYFSADMVGEYVKWEDSFIEVTNYNSTTEIEGDVVGGSSGRNGKLTGSLPTNPFDVDEGARTVVVQHPDHSFKVGDIVSFSGQGSMEAYPGITGWMLARTLEIIEIIDEGSYRVEVARSWTSNQTVQQSWTQGEVIEGEDPNDVRLFTSLGFNPDWAYLVEVTSTSSSWPNISSSDHSFYSGYRMKVDQSNIANTSGLIRFSLTTGSISDDDVKGLGSQAIGGANVKWHPSSGVATRNFGETVFSDRNGYAGCGVFHEQRLWLAASLQDPSFLASSRIGSYKDFGVSMGLDDESIQFKVTGSEEISQIKYMVSGTNLQIFTETQEMYAPRQREGTYTPGTFGVVAQTPYGCAGIKPRKFDESTIFIQANKKSAREFIFSSRYASHSSPSLSILASHFLTNPQDLGVVYGASGQQEQYAMVVNTDGTIAVMYSNRAEERLGWAQWNFDGDITPERVCVVGDKVFLTVWDTQQSVRHLIRLEETEQDYLDLSYYAGEVTPVSSFTAPAHLWNRTCQVLQGNQWHEQVTVAANGLVTMAAPASDITIGVANTVQIKWLPPTVALPTGPRFGTIKGTAKAIVHFHQTHPGVLINGVNIKHRNVSDDPWIDYEFTGKRHINMLGYNRDPKVDVTQMNPGVIQVLGKTLGVLI